MVDAVRTRLPKIPSASTAQTGRVPIFHGRRRSSDWTRPPRTADASTDFRGRVQEENRTRPCWRPSSSIVKCKRVHLIHWTRPSVWKTDANHVPIPAFRNKSRILPQYRLKYSHISKLTYLKLFLTMSMYISNGKSGFVVLTKSLSARPPLLLSYTQPRPAVTLADFYLFAARHLPDCGPLARSV